MKTLKEALVHKHMDRGVSKKQLQDGDVIEIENMHHEDLGVICGDRVCLEGHFVSMSIHVIDELWDDNLKGIRSVPDIIKVYKKPKSLDFSYIKENLRFMQWSDMMVYIEKVLSRSKPIIVHS